MDFTDLSTQAVTIIATYLGSIGSGLAGRIKDSAVDQLYELVASRLKQSPLGAAAISGLEERPDQASRQAIAASATAEAMADDPQFAKSVGTAVRAIHISQGGVGRGDIGEQVNISAGGSMAIRGSTIANQINKSRTTKIGFGAVGLVVAALVIVLVTRHTVDAQRPGLDPDAEQLGTIGTDPGEQGARETVRAYLDSWSVGNTRLMCQLIVPDTVTRIQFGTGGMTCAQYMHSIYERASDSVHEKLGRNNEIVKWHPAQYGADRGFFELSQNQPTKGDKLLSVTYESGRWLVEPKL